MSETEHPPTPPLLDGIRIVEIAHPLTEYGGQILAGIGAEVFLVEPPSGASTRARAPRVPGSGDSTRGSIAFLARNTNKSSVVVDPDDPLDIALLDGLIRSSDVVLSADASAYHHLVAASVGSCETGAARITITDRLGLGTSSIVGFAASGGLSSSGWPGKVPCNAPSWLALDGASIYAAVMSMVSLLVSERTGVKLHYDVPYEQAATCSIAPWTRLLHSMGVTVAGQGLRSERLGAGPYPVYPASDGFVRIIVITPRQWLAFLELLGRPAELVAGPFGDAGHRARNSDALVEACSQYNGTRSVDELFHGGQRIGLTITPMNTLRSFREDAHVVARGMFVEVDDPEFGTMELLRPPAVVDPKGLVPSVRPAPALGSHTAHARRLVGEPRPPSPRKPDGATPVDPLRPLEGLRILELGVGAVVPEASSVLALLGADVLKIESLVQVDFLRRNGRGGDIDNSPTFTQLNLGVRSVAVDMSTPEGIDLVGRLVARCDAVVENMRAPVAARWGLDYAGARSHREDIVSVSSQGFGEGPYARYQSFGPNLLTFDGIASLWAHPGDELAVGATLAHPDHTAGKQAFVLLLAALLRRERGGGGCSIEAAQIENAASLVGDRFLEQTFDDHDRSPLGNRSRDMAPHGCYPCAADRWIALAVESDDQWEALRSVIADDWFDQPELASSTGRIARAGELDERLSEMTRNRDAVALEGALRAGGVPASRMVTGEDMAADGEAHAARFFAEVLHPTAGPQVCTAIPVTTPEGRRPPMVRAPMIGEHTDAVLGDLLGISPDEIASLRSNRTIGY